MRARLGINTCFAVKRWPRPDDWARIVRDELGLEVVELSLDLIEDFGGRAVNQVRSALDEYGLRAETVFTGLAAYSLNLLMHPDAEYRAAARRWYREAIDLTAQLGATAVGGHVGALTVPDGADPATRAQRWAGLREHLIPTGDDHRRDDDRVDFLGDERTDGFELLFFLPLGVGEFEVDPLLLRFFLHVLGPRGAPVALIADL